MKFNLYQEIRNIQTLSIGIIKAYNFEQCFCSDNVYEFIPYLIIDEQTGEEYWEAEWNLEKLNEILSIN